MNACNQLAQMMIRQSLATGHGDTVADLIRELEPQIERLRAQLPDGMKDCTIVFKECERGHGTLTATNWVQHECQQCEIERLRAEVAAENRPMLADDATKKSFDTLTDYVDRSTHWQEGGATRHDAKYALDVLSDSIEWTELGLAEWRDLGLKMAKQAAELRAEVGGLQSARIAYASEFPLNADGEPDVGSIHQNIRSLKAERDRLRELLNEAWPYVGENLQSRIDAATEEQKK